MKHQLEKQLSEATAVVGEWKSTITQIKSRFDLATLALANSKTTREANALRAEMGDAAALKAITQARSDGHDAEEIMGDLQHALGDAQVRLTEAETAAKSAAQALARHEADVLIEERVGVSGELDTAIAVVAAIYRKYEKLGVQIANMDVLPRNLHGMSNHEGAVGTRRVRAAMPPFVQTLYPGCNHDEAPKESLATSEARFWGLPDQTEKKAA